MANTLKFGNGNWATKDGSTLAYNDESGFNPLPFDFTRASSATVVNKNGLIETVATGIPRIDFLGNTQGALLLEPSRTNLITESEAFASTYWLKSGASIQGDASTAGAELVTNGDFSNGLNNWTVNGGSYATIVSGALNSNNTDAGNWFAENVSQDIPFVNGKTYKVTFKAKNISGNLNLRLTQGVNVIFNGNITSSFVNYEVFYTANADNSSVRIFCNDNVGQFQIDNVSVKEVQGFAFPSADSPLGAFKLVESVANESHTITSGEAVVTSGATTTKSIIVKPNGRRWVLLLDINKPDSRAWFDLELGVVGSLQSNAISSKIEKLSNGYYRCSTTSAVASTSSKLRMEIVEGNNTTTGYQGDGTSGVYIYGVQLEAGSYATSLINTSGSAVTREADVCDNGANSEVINSTEGVLYAQVSGLVNGGVDRTIALSDGTISNYLRITLHSNSSRIAFFSPQGVNYNNFDFSQTDNLKIAFQYKENDWKIYINGTLKATDTSALTFSANTLSKLTFDLAGTNPFFGKTKDLRIFTTSLTDAELIALTTI